MAKASKRKGLSAKTRFEVFKRDGFKCQYCGATPPSAVLQIDHIDPVANGGDNSIDNLVTSCDQCNGGKGARLLSSVPQSLADRAAEIAEREKQLKGYNAAIRAQRQRLEWDCWEVSDVFMEHFCPDDPHIRKDYMQSIRLFLGRLALYEVVDAMEKAVSSRAARSESAAFRYFCGICWTKIREQSL